MPRLVFVSDLHQQWITPPEGDILFICGDSTWQGTAKEVHNFKDWLNEQRSRYKHRVFVAGNHDFNCEFWGPTLAEETDSIYLEDSGCELMGLKIYGSPITPTFGQWHFMKDRGDDIRKTWDKIPEGLSILLTHGPPFGILDWAPRSKESVGCWDLLDIVKKRKPQVHCFGHLHFDGGKTLDRFGIKFINAAVCNEEYSPENDVIVVEL